jgi:hypothetical protein
MSPSLTHQLAPTDFASATAFLYAGSSPRQIGVVSGAIDPQRAAVLRGQVCDRDGHALAGVQVTVLNHSEYGSTQTSAEGMFDLAVNGGELLTAVYTKTGYLPVQRQVWAALVDYAWLPDVLLMPRDSRVTTVDLTANVPMQAAQGSLVSDQDGARRGTLLIPQGTQAALYTSGGTTQTVTTLNLRLTEYTRGAGGPLAMPAQLPPASGYTYAIELSADEAQTKVNGKDVLFSRPVFFGDTVRGEMEVTGLKPFPRLGGGAVDITITVKNQKDESVMSGKWVILIQSKPAA